MLAIAAAACDPAGAVQRNQERQATVTMPAGELVVFDFADAAEVNAWRAIDDVVMGGVSRSALVAELGFATFTGELSRERGGGFASVRTLPRDFGLAGRRAIALRVRGDGRQYQLRARTDDGFDGIAYSAAFDTEPGTWRELELGFDRFAATFRGRSVPGAPALDPARIRQLGVMLSGDQVGRFRLDIDWIHAR